MADVKWTDAQKRAIESRGNVLVSAAAGSGKTATLSAKIMHLLRTCEDVSIDSFLIVTFTNAAASELRSRISAEITKAAQSDRTMLRHKKNLCSADICTIHSFCLKLLRRYFTVLGISPDFAVADETAAMVMKSRAMESTVDDFFKGELKPLDGSCDVFTLADSIGKTKDASGLDGELRSLDEKLSSLGLGTDYLRLCADGLDSCTDADFLKTPYGGEIYRYVRESAEHYSRLLADVKSRMAESPVVVEKYMPAADALDHYVDRILRAGDSYDRLKDAVATYEAVKLGTLTAKNKTEASEQFKIVRDEVKETFAAIANKYFTATPEVISDTCRRTAEVLRCAADVLDVYRERYAALKSERGVLDFSDLEELALRLLENGDGTPSPIALEAGERYRFVFIDEYQDTNSVQDRIFRAVSTGAEKFFVGDIKQSIYRFRGAEPQVFSGYRVAWPEDEADNAQREGYPVGHSIFMSENFRCARPVIEFVNTVSRYMFPHGGIPFTESDCLVYGGVASGDVPVEVCLLDGSRDKKDEESTIPAVTEAEYVAERIYRLIRDEGYSPSDIAILLRSANYSGGGFEEALKSRGIPVNRAGGSPFADESEVMLTLDILRAVDNPMRDVSLAGAMMSSVFGFTVDDMTRIRMRDGDCPLYTSVCLAAEGSGEVAAKCREFLAKLTSLRHAQRGMTADRFIDHLYAECDLLRCPEVTGKLFGEKNLRTLHELARSYETGVFGGLYGFLAFIDEKLESGTLTTEGQNDGGGVTIISIHKSKGLEYKVCFLSECGKARNTSDETSRVLFDKELGIGLRLPDPGGLVLCGNPIRDAVALKLAREGAMEEMRILYVAMTRAKERLVVTAKCRTEPERELENARLQSGFADGYLVLSNSRLIDHILQSLLSDPEASYRLTTVPKHADLSEETLTVKDTEETSDPVTSDEAELIRERLAFSYPYAHLAGIPSKLAVSALYPTVLDDAEVAISLAPAIAAAEDEAIAEMTADGQVTDLTDGAGVPAEESTDTVTDAPTSDADEDEMPRPRFMTGATTTASVDRGTATHVFLQFADFAALRAGHIRDELARLVEKGFITEKMASLVNRAQVERFAAGSLVERILAAKRVIREFRFNLPLPAASFTENEDLRRRLTADGNTVTVQGVFDCVFEDGDGRLVLLDYKTDYMTAEELQSPELGRDKLRRRHSLQLSYYAKAVELLFGRAPDEVYVYSLPLGEGVPMEAGV